MLGMAPLVCGVVVGDGEAEGGGDGEAEGGGEGEAEGGGEGEAEGGGEGDRCVACAGHSSSGPCSAPGKPLGMW